MFNVKNSLKIATAISLSVLAYTTTLQAVDDSSSSSANLKMVKDSKLLKTYIKEGVNLGSYKSVMMTESKVSFKDGWLKRYNQNQRSSSQKLSTKDADKVKQRIEDQFQVSFPKYLHVNAGYSMVKSAGEKTLLLKAIISDLVVNGPDNQSASFTEIWVKQVGSATLTLEIYDAKSNELLGKIISKDETTDNHRLIRTNRVMNRSAFIHVYNRWARDLINFIQ